MRRMMLLLSLMAAMSTVRAEEAGKPLARRHFELTYEAAVTVIPEGAQVVDFWVPIASDTPEQTVVLDETSLPEGASIGEEATYGNRILHVQWKAPFPERPGVKLRFDVVRKEVLVPQAKALAPDQAVPASPALARYLGPSAMVPLEGRLASIADELQLEAAHPLAAGRKAYDYVVELMTYGKTAPGWGRGDALWACDSRTGNCSDFHSVFIGLARTREIPSYFEIGFPLPPDATEGEIGGYHCWAWFLGGESAGWVPVDASEADKHPELFDYYFGALTADRVAFSRGRDLTLVPPQKGGPLNFFIYPYVEIDGVAGGEIEKKFSFRNLE